MVSYGRFDSLAAGIGEGTAEYQRTGNIKQALAKGAVTGAIDQVSGWAGSKTMKGAGGKLIKENHALKSKISSTVRKRAYEKTKKGTSKFIDGAFDLRNMSHIYKANKNTVRDGLQRSVVDGLGADIGKKVGKKFTP
jgi:hypothetical protein